MLLVELTLLKTETWRGIERCDRNGDEHMHIDERVLSKEEWGYTLLVRTDRQEVVGKQQSRCKVMKTGSVTNEESKYRPGYRTNRRTYAVLNI